MNTQNLPPLPSIDGDVELTLSVYTHQSVQNLYNNINSPKEYDSDRLAELGEHVLDLATTNYLYNKRPIMNANDIKTERINILDSERINHWLEAYNLKSRLRTSSPSVYNDPQEMRQYFLAYVGAVYLSSGMSTAENWLVQLIDPNAQPLDFPGQASDPLANAISMPPQYSLPPPAPTTQPPPLPHPLPPGYPPASNSTSSTSAMSIPWLSLAAVNQAASQRHASINYVADTMTGPPHAPTWTVHCLSKIIAPRTC
ncbi:ribonuclease III domain-containing protein [Rhodocollybia butyracea]|uniref:Ribonuclease III domain-containing protein n=1 Tax=Rhodocollybia butyracea TaxID=206335 RepID=A0A9P5UD66_9AGAR|nr:ribonuclease III domain-containing protein [Rhodocollybia butyracea]